MYLYAFHYVLPSRLLFSDVSNIHIGTYDDHESAIEVTNVAIEHCSII